MPLKSKYLFIASMDVDQEHESTFHEVYDREHIPNLSGVPGVLSVARFQRQELTMLIGGERKTIRLENEPAFTAFYELESPEVLLSDAWGKAIEKGRWPTEVRPHTKNRKHFLLKRLGPKS